MTFDWLTITPITGGAGKTTHALSVNTENRENADRQKAFRVMMPDGVTHTEITVTQHRRKRSFGKAFSRDFG